MSRTVSIGFLGGIELSGNVRTLLRNLRRLLCSRRQTFDCDLLVSEDVETPDGYRSVAISHPQVKTARDRIRVLRMATTQYAVEETPDVLVQITRFPTHGPALAIAGWRTSTPTVTRLAGDNFREYRFENGQKASLRTFALKNVFALTAVHIPDAVVVLGPSGRQDINRRLRRENVWEIPQPVDGSRFTPGDAPEVREELGIDPDEKLLLTVGRVSRRKGAETIHRIASTLDDQTWVVVGDGPMREPLSEIENVHTTGHLPHDQTVDYYREADVYVHPSLHDGLPNVLLEATACGTPCIARDVGECSTIAVETFDEDADLISLLQKQYDSVELDARFDEERLASRYEALLMKVAK